MSRKAHARLDNADVISLNIHRHNVARHLVCPKVQNFVRYGAEQSDSTIQAVPALKSVRWVGSGALWDVYEVKLLDENETPTEHPSKLKPTGLIVKYAHLPTFDHMADSGEFKYTSESAFKSAIVEWHILSTVLYDIQGQHVPTLYGTFRNEEENMICTIMEDVGDAFWRVDFLYELTNKEKKQTKIAYEALHQRRVFHNDIRVNNICLAPDGNIRIVDFGDARVTKDDMALEWEQQWVLMQMGWATWLPLFINRDRMKEAVSHPSESREPKDDQVNWDEPTCLVRPDVYENRPRDQTFTFRAKAAGVSKRKKPASAKLGNKAAHSTKRMKQSAKGVV
ncbi:uncharacterized protein IL334_001034 [Kwoniella shivajii]|uniref:Protein kinase domain-containing protein n=1 Tax=Kwoniella shivajii TaxID=564305 RepID=A0ABZ1CQT2_9TREE|nr:hypothetical protein IL334_001034 [Kwoniella shivajii]